MRIYTSSNAPNPLHKVRLIKTSVVDLTKKQYSMPFPEVLLYQDAADTLTSVAAFTQLRKVVRRLSLIFSVTCASAFGCAVATQ